MTPELQPEEIIKITNGIETSVIAGAVSFLVLKWKLVAKMAMRMIGRELAEQERARPCEDAKNLMIKVEGLSKDVVDMHKRLDDGECKFRMLVDGQTKTTEAIHELGASVKSLANSVTMQVQDNKNQMELLCKQHLAYKELIDEKLRSQKELLVEKIGNVQASQPDIMRTGTDECARMTETKLLRRMALDLAAREAVRDLTSGKQF